MYKGLTNDEVLRRLETYGPNKVPEKRESIFVVFLKKFTGLTPFAIEVAATISFVLGKFADFAIMVSLLLVNSVVGVFHEHRASKAIEMLKSRLKVSVKALRNGSWVDVNAEDVVPDDIVKISMGDIVLLSAGDIVPADARVVKAKDLFVDESALTGESFPVEKSDRPLESYEPSMTMWSNYLFMGTSVVSGTATALVVRTGSLTEYGKIAGRLVRKKGETEFERSLRSFGYMVMQVTFLLVIFVFFINALYMREIVNSLLFAVALAVGLTPELLPMIVAITLSKGAVIMSRKKVIVKRLAAIQNFGSMDVLCTDKTGTLTENQVKLVLYVDLNGNESSKVLLYSYLNSYYQTGIRSPLDEAILRFREVSVEDYKKIDEIPFDSVRKRLSVVVEHGSQKLLITKGAPEEVINVSSFYEDRGLVYSMTDEVRRSIKQKYDKFSAEGYRVLAVAYKLLREDKPAYTVDDEKEMVFLGFLVFIDPPKETVREALKLLRSSGIEVKILTGDNELVTKKVCEYLGFNVKKVVTGSEIAELPDHVLARVVEEANVFCRLTPAQKERVVNALRSNGHVVGFLGDGVNDAPSLKAADIGISVDNAVDVAKEFAEIILLQKDLRVLYDGVLEGRKTLGNVMKYILMGISSNFGNMFSVALASLFLPFLPMLPIQILLNNLLYTFSQTAIPTDDVDVEYVEKPKRLDVHFIKLFMACLGPVSSLFDFLTFFTMLYIFKASESLFQTAWFIESLTSQTLVVLVIRTTRSPFWRSRPSRALFFATVAISSSALILPFTPLGKIFKLVEPPATFYIVLAVIIGTYLTLAEVIKNWFYRRYGYRLEQSSTLYSKGYLGFAPTNSFGSET